MYFFIIVQLLMTLFGCSVGQLAKPTMESTESVNSGVVTVDLPFEDEYETYCEESVYSLDVEFHVPDAEEETPLYAPFSGTLYVHAANALSSFGLHVNIRVDDDTYVILGHLKEVFVADGEKVVAGELIGYAEDQVLLGRHRGSAQADGMYGTSEDSLEFLLKDGQDSIVTQAVPLRELMCSSEHVYRSALKTVLWHPNGSLLRSPSSATVYLVENGQLWPFMSHEAFTSRGYDSEDVALMSESERNCYARGDNIEGTSFSMSANVYPDGVLISPDGLKGVYVMTDGIAMPIDTHDTFLFAGWSNRLIYDVSQADFNVKVTKKGSCTEHTFCLSAEDLTTCGGPDEVWQADTGRTPEEDDHEPGMDDE